MQSGLPEHIILAEANRDGHMSATYALHTCITAGRLIMCGQEFKHLSQAHNDVVSASTAQAMCLQPAFQG